MDKINMLVRQDLVNRGEVIDDNTIRGNRGSAMSVGDTILARKNTTIEQQDHRTTDRILNGDLFRLDVIHADGSITATHTGRGEKMWVPADYVGAHMELGYASTVHRSQGSTVDVARCVVGSTMDQAGLYVGLTRGKHVNAPYVVTDLTLNEGVEVGHLHHSGDEDAPTAREILEHVVTNDRRELSAHETMWNHDAAQGDPERQAALWHYGQEAAIRAYLDEIMPAYRELLPAHFQEQIDTSEDGDRPIRSALREYILDGQNLADILPDVFRHCDGSEDVARVIAACIRTHMGDDHGTDGLPPLTANSDRELLDWLSANRPQPTPTLVESPALQPGQAIENQDLSHCTLDGGGASPGGARLTVVTFDDVTATGVDLSGASLAKTKIRSSTMTHTPFNNAELGTPAKPVTFIGSDLSQSSFSQAHLRAVVARTSDLSHGRMESATVGPVSFAFCDLNGITTDERTVVHHAADVTECTGATDLDVTTTDLIIDDEPTSAHRQQPTESSEHVVPEDASQQTPGLDL